MLLAMMVMIVQMVMIISRDNIDEDAPPGLESTQYAFAEERPLAAQKKSPLQFKHYHHNHNHSCVIV